jgi:hypothetical protein
VARRRERAELLVATLDVAPELPPAAPNGLDTERADPVAVGPGRCLTYASILRSFVESWEREFS